MQQEQRLFPLTEPTRQSSPAKIVTAPVAITMRREETKAPVEENVMITVLTFWPASLSILLLALFTVCKIRRLYK